MDVFSLTRPGFLRTKIKKFWTPQIKDPRSKDHFQNWSKIVNSADQEIKDHCGSVLRDGSKIKDQQITFWKDHGSTKDQGSKFTDQKFQFLSTSSYLLHSLSNLLIVENNSHWNSKANILWVQKATHIVETSQKTQWYCFPLKKKLFETECFDEKRIYEFKQKKSFLRLIFRRKKNMWV